MNWQNRLWINAGTNYLRVAVRLVTGLVMFRLLFQYFSDEQFGYWVLLWSVFGMTVLVDFGLGSAAKRETAYCCAHNKWDDLSQLISTMVTAFAGVGILIMLICALARPFFLEIIHVSPQNIESFSKAYWIFFGSMAICFPLGLFPEVLAGCQRLDLANLTVTASYLVNLVLVFLGVRYNWSLETFILIGVGCTLVPNLLTVIFVRRLLPKLRISPRLFHFPHVKGVLSFSVVAYIITLTNIIISKVDQLVISVIIGVASVTVYQAGYKLAEVFGTGTQQMQRALAPAAAHLRAKGDHSALSRLVLKTTRITALVGLPAYAYCVAYMEPLVCIVTGLEAIGVTTFLVGHSLLLATFSFVLTNSCAKEIMVMSGWERPLLRLSVLEAGANIVLSVTLAFALRAWDWGVVGVAVGTLIPAVLVGWFGVLPLTLKFANIGLRQWIEEAFFSVLKPTALSLAILGILHVLWPIPERSRILFMAARAGLVMVPVLYYLYKNRKNLL